MPSNTLSSFGLEHRTFGQIDAIGDDEIQSISSDESNKHCLGDWRARVAEPRSDAESNVESRKRDGTLMRLAP